MNVARDKNAAQEVHADFDPLVERSFASLRLAIEIFNRPDDQGRMEAVLILLHHAFELALKAILVRETGTAHDDERGYSYGFDKCLALTTENLKLLNADDRRFLSMLDNLRDSAVHYYHRMSEDLLYVFAQGAVTLYDDLILKITGHALKERLPSRVLPLCSRPPKDLQLLIDEEFEALRTAIRESGLTQAEAVAALRPLIAFSIAAEEKHRRPSNSELETAIDNLQKADHWRIVFPQIAQLQFSTDGDAIAVGLKIVKNDAFAMPVQVVKPGDNVHPVGTVIVKEVNLLDKFTMGAKQLGEKLGVSTVKAVALFRELKLQDDAECFRVIRIGSQEHKRYSKRALDVLRDNIDKIDAAWNNHRSRIRKRPR